ncbi:ATPase AAA [Ruegeria sp. ANG-R]|uniref:ATPase AAA n=1 Tax=Ruegeria sp. ANG-R TaxID=1577903 RepID=UPI00057D62DE|nr:ATPase AAA [Ruegeria sp. ANG-R]KIC42508.1 ATPase AAA [Ruegeria sp. ANG-R]
MKSLSALGQRIVIVGPSNSGKSTLAVSIAKKLSLRAVHLDQLRHMPNTNWLERPDEEFARLHNTAIMNEGWVMEGNYSGLLPQRLDRASGIILLNSNVWLRYVRYLKRTLKNNGVRAGHLEGSQDKLSWKMTNWIIKTRNKAARYEKIVRKTGKPMVMCYTSKDLHHLYREWDLSLR